MKRLMVFALLAALVLSFVVFSQDSFAIVEDVCKYDISNSDICANQNRNDPKPVFVTIINFLLWLSFIVAVIVAIMAGAKYAMSGGDSGKTASAKNTLIGAVLGILVSVLALVLVNFVVNLVGK